jgi:xanthosine utilization system XapX-like protein
MNARIETQSSELKLPISFTRGSSYPLIAGLLAGAVLLFGCGFPYFLGRSPSPTALIVGVLIAAALLALNRDLLAPATITISRSEVAIIPRTLLGAQEDKKITREISEFDRVEAVCQWVQSNRPAHIGVIYLRSKTKPKRVSWWHLKKSFDDVNGDIFVPAAAFDTSGYKELARQLAKALGLNYQHIEISSLTGKSYKGGPS